MMSRYPWLVVHLALWAVVLGVLLSGCRPIVDPIRQAHGEPPPLPHPLRPVLFPANP